jgi:hypothetical protein
MHFRYAERMFWSIEGVRSSDPKEVDYAIDKISAPRSIELYFSTQAFLHCLPQILVQLNILMRQDFDINRQTGKNIQLILKYRCRGSNMNNLQLTLKS